VKHVIIWMGKKASQDLVLLMRRSGDNSQRSGALVMNRERSNCHPGVALSMNSETWFLHS
jgi:hypothetical protein